MNERRHSQLLIAIACLVSAVAVLLATARGIGLSPDSLQYLAASENAAAGNGLMTFGWEGEPTPLRHFPPGYPVLLAPAYQLRVSPHAFARWSNVALFVLTILLAAAITRRIAPQSTWAPAVVAVASAFAHDLVVVHSMAWSEPLYLTLSLAGVLALGTGIDRRRIGLLVLAAIAAACAALVRFVGIANIAALGLAILLWWPGSPWRRVSTAFALGLIAALPLGLLLLAGSGEGVANRQLGWYPLDPIDLRFALAVAAKWVTPSNETSIGTAVWALLLFAFVALVLVRALARETVRPAHTVLARVLVLYGASYVMVFVLAMSVIDAQTVFEPRHMTPVFLTVLILGISWLAHQSLEEPLVRFAVGATVAYLLAVNVMRLLPWLREVSANGLALRRIEQDAVALLNASRRLPGAAQLYSNDPYFMRVHTPRVVAGLPRERDPNSLLPNPRFRKQVQAICESAAARPTYLILFDDPMSSDPTARGDIATQSGEVAFLPGGTMVRVRPHCASTALRANGP